jgi:hypothetical protein
MLHANLTFGTIARDPTGALFTSFQSLGASRTAVLTGPQGERHYSLLLNKM